MHFSSRLSQRVRHDEILQTNSYGFSLAPWTFPLIRSKITLIKGVSLAALKLKESGKLGVGGFGELGEGSQSLPFIKEKGFGLVNNSTHAVPLKHPHKISSWLLSTQTQSPPESEATLSSADFVLLN
jgi:hypothetical protein